MGITLFFINKISSQASSFFSTGTYVQSEWRRGIYMGWWAKDDRKDIILLNLGPTKSPSESTFKGILGSTPNSIYHRPWYIDNDGWSGQSLQIRLNVSIDMMI